MFFLHFFRLEKYVESGYKSWLKSQGRTEQLADMDVAEAIEALAQQEQWSKCKQVAQENGALSTYLVLHASNLLRASEYLIDPSFFYTFTNKLF
jgi:hypothetical protein